MKLKIYHILILACMLISRPSINFASHILGGEITYKYIGNDSFLVTNTFYRDCNASTSITAIPFTVTLPGTSGNYNVNTSIILTKDITPVSVGTQSRCANSSSTFPFGEQMIVMTGKFKTDPTICDYTISQSLCCLGGIITTGASGDNLYIESDLNICEIGRTSCRERV